jgi:hypothetical protein
MTETSTNGRRDADLPLVSALITAYGCARFLPEALDSALAQAAGC